MNGFADETTIHVSSGNGGDGVVSFRREKYVPKGGPDGGDGGKGGDIVFVVRENLKTLSHLKLKRHFAAENGKRGSGNKKHGRDGRDVEIPVPPGTLLTGTEDGEPLADLLEKGTRLVLLRGGGAVRGIPTTQRPPTRLQDTPKRGSPGIRWTFEWNCI